MRSAFILLGEAGLLMSVLESGLEANLAAARQVGLPGFVVASIGSWLGPCPIAFGIAKAFGVRYSEAFVCAFCFASSSGSVAVERLRRAKVIKRTIIIFCLCDFPFQNKSILHDKGGEHSSGPTGDGLDHND